MIDRESALPWLLGVANHVLRNHRRASRRYRDALRRIVPAEEAAGDHADAVAASVDIERLMATVRQALMQLPRHEREVVELCMWSGLDQRAAAVALGVSVGTVKSRMHRARRRLAASLSHDRGPSQRPLAPRGAGPHVPEEDA